MSAYEEEPTLLLAPAPKLGTAMPAQTTGHGLEPEVIADAPAVINATTASQDALQSWLTSLNTRAPQGSTPVKSLMAAAQPLLQGLPLLRGATACPNVQMLHHTLVQGLKQFNTDCQQLGLPSAQRISTRYMLCSALDEAVLSTPWGITSQWSHRALLSLFHHETTGGEKVFQVLAQLMQQPREHLAVLEVFYVCLAMGFEGQFKVMPHGQEKRARLRSELYTQCASYRAQAVGGGGGFCNRFLGGRSVPSNDGSGNAVSRNNNSANNASGNNISENNASDNYVSGNQNTLINETVMLNDNNAHIYQPRSLKFGFVLTFLILSMAYFGFDLWLNQLEAPLAEQLKSSIDTVSQQPLVRQ